MSINVCCDKNADNEACRCNSKYMKANEARYIAEKSHAKLNEISQIQLENTLQDIKKEAEKGEFRLDNAFEGVNYKNKTLLVKALQEIGYGVKIHTHNNETYYIISW